MVQEIAARPAQTNEEDLVPVDGYQDYRRQLGKTFRALREEIPDVMAGFGALHKAAMAEGALDVKTKELMETIGVAIMMSGGPGTIYAAEAYKAVEELAA